MDLFCNGDGKISIQDMIEGDLQGHHCHNDLGIIPPPPLFTVNFQPELNISDSHNDAVHALLSKASGVDSIDVTAAFSQSGSVHLPGLQHFLMKTENGNPNLLVNPTTGLPVHHQHHDTFDLCKVNVEDSETSSVLQNQDVQMMSPNHSVQFLTTLVNPQPKLQEHFTQQTISRPLLTAKTVQQPLQSIQNTNVSSHQTLTQHLLLNNGLRKLQKDPNEKVWPKPVYSYSCLIAMALKNSETGALPVSEIYSFMTENFPYFKTAPDGWKNSVRHNLSLNKCFEKIENPRANGNTRKGCLWGLNPNKIEKMEDEIVKWRKKDPAAVKRSMSSPDRLEEIERGTIGSHAPLPPEYLKALREAQLMRLNNMHANPSINNHLINGGGLQTVASASISKPTLTMVTPVYMSDSKSMSAAVHTLKSTHKTQLLTTQATYKQAQQQNVIQTKSKGGGVKVTMVEVLPANKIQHIKSEHSDTPADTKPIVISMNHKEAVQLLRSDVLKPRALTASDVIVKREPQTGPEAAEESMMLDNNLFFDHGDSSHLPDLALHNGLWDDLTSEGIDFSDIATNGLNLSFSTTPSPANAHNVAGIHRYLTLNSVNM